MKLRRMSFCESVGCCAMLNVPDSGIRRIAPSLTKSSIYSVLVSYVLSVIIPAIFLWSRVLVPLSPSLKSSIEPSGRRYPASRISVVVPNSFFASAKSCSRCSAVRNITCPCITDSLISGVTSTECQPSSFSRLGRVRSATCTPHFLPYLFIQLTSFWS